MKKSNRVLFIPASIIISIVSCCAISLPFNPAISANAIIFNDPDELSRIYKFELPDQITNEQVARILTDEFLDKFRVGKLGWYNWLWSYQINSITISDDGSFMAVGEQITLYPVIHSSWADTWVGYASDIGNGQTQIIWFMSLEDKGSYYVLKGPYSGG